MWLFNPFYKFSDRPNFVLDDSSLTLDDYSSMRYMNRNLLTQFLKSAITAGLSSASLSFSELAVIENNDENWAGPKERER